MKSLPLTATWRPVRTMAEAMVDQTGETDHRAVGGGVQAHTP
jgi:hypothetical protein